jgi:hypothetical protein
VCQILVAKMLRISTKKLLVDRNWQSFWLPPSIVVFCQGRRLSWRLRDREQTTSSRKERFWLQFFKCNHPVQRFPREGTKFATSFHPNDFFFSKKKVFCLDQMIFVLHFFSTVNAILLYLLFRIYYNNTFLLIKP